MPANPTIALPRLPPWLSLESCDGCGQTYRSFRAFSGNLFATVRREAEPFIGGERPDLSPWFWSRRCVLHLARVRKMELWVERHQLCGGD